MPTPILSTKLYVPPPRANCVPRPQLVERLNEGLHSGLTLIAAPAGYGKSTLLSDWIDQRARQDPKLRVAWLSLDEADNDPFQFLLYLAAALHSAEPSCGADAMAALLAPQPPSAESILTDLINDIDGITGDILLVLDDYHAVHSPKVDEALAFLLEHLPARLRLVIATREDPMLPLAQMRARGELAELRAADLRFSTNEAADFLRRVMGLELTAEDVAALESRTEGWIAGLQLAALSMRGQKDIAGFIRSFTGSHRFVLDYLVEEVLQRQPEGVQTFLLRTSILDRMCGPLCDAVLLEPSASGQETLEELERANLFLIPLDNERRWYRYHHLFGELLRQRLGNPQGLSEYHLRASQWHEEHGDLGAAFHHAIAAGDSVRAAGLAETAYQGMEEGFRTAAWLGWVEKLPEGVIRVRPVLCTQIGWAFANAGEPQSSELRLQDAERSMEGSDAANEAQLKPLPATIALARAYNAQVQGNPAAAVKYAELALQILPEDDFVRRAKAISTLEITHWASGDLESAIRGIGDWMGRMTKAGNHVFVVASAFAVADLLVGLGRLSEAERTYQEALQLAAQHGQETEHITAHHHLGLSMIYRQRGDDTLAAQHLNRAGELGPLTTLVDWRYRWYVAQAQLKEAAGDLETALTLLEEAKGFYVQTLVPDLRPIAALKARIYLKQGRPDEARAWAVERGLSLADEASYLHEFEYLTLARLELANPQVNVLLARLLQAAEAQRRRGSALDILLVQALALEAHGNRPQALPAIKRALSLAEPEDYIRLFVEEGEPMRTLLLDFRAAYERQAAHPLLGYVDRILAAFSQPAEAPSQSPSKNRTSEIIEPLTDREIEVLRLIAEGQSNTEISQRLYLALSTVKGHNLRIFSKLQAQNRTEAVARARALGLL